MSKQTLGGNRLGSGAGTQIETKGFQRSSHDMGYVWKSTSASGTLIPFMVEPILPGSSMDIDLDTIVMTQPTIGPLFGSYKIQLDVFLCPIRLYNAYLHMNALNIGLNMSEIKLPQMLLTAEYDENEILQDNSQINPSSLLSYLNIRGIGRGETTNRIEREFNALSYLMYWDIYKNYYANKQEGIGMFINNDIAGDEILTTDAEIRKSGGLTHNIYDVNASVQMSIYDELIIYLDAVPRGQTLLEASIIINVNEVPRTIDFVFDEVIVEYTRGRTKVTAKNAKAAFTAGVLTWKVVPQEILLKDSDERKPKLEAFPLSHIDDMRLEILTNQSKVTPFVINVDFLKQPYQGIDDNNIVDGKVVYKKQKTQQGLGIKTYQSDLFNNWIDTEWIDGDNGVNALTAVDVSSGEFTMDALNMAKKVYEMLNGIAGSGGTYNNWVETVFDHQGFRSYETPVYLGGLIRELSFDEVVSNTGTTDAPLGTLAGRGAMTSKKKGGKIKVSVDEPSYVMGIFSITPRVDYSQGNKWDNNLKTMDDFHKPYLDEIGFQDLITDQMHWADTSIITGDVAFKSAGKVPAWINYMTNVNQVRGNFADEKQQMFMTLNRRYEIGADGIEDLTTYIDPSKFNHIFADTRLDAQNFWVQIKVDNIARRKMSAKVMPNL